MRSRGREDEGGRRLGRIVCVEFIGLTRVVQRTQSCADSSASAPLVSESALGRQVCLARYHTGLLCFWAVSLVQGFSFQGLCTTNGGMEGSGNDRFNPFLRGTHPLVG